MSNLVRRLLEEYLPKYERAYEQAWAEIMAREFPKDDLVPKSEPSTRRVGRPRKVDNSDEQHKPQS